jgi:NAD-dependent SIR2 family protein deacetylase
MGVDSGLPDFRGDDGFWKAYPPFRGRSFVEMSNPMWFFDDPSQAWGFFGHRLGLYRTTTPHAGFDLLRAWAERASLGAFVFTSNVDGQFQRAGFPPESVLECHGSLHWLQCSYPCSQRVWPADEVSVEVDPKTVRAAAPLPLCPHCDAVARPNVLMFGDGQWLPGRHEEQRLRYRSWRREAAGARIVAVEIGAGTAIPTVRYECESAAHTVVRINPRESQTSPGGISLAGGALEMLAAIDARLPVSRRPRP